MPLYANAIELIRANLEQIAKGYKVRPVAIGTLTDAQVRAINSHRQSQNQTLLPIVAEVLFVGSHIYKSRCERDGYTIEDVIAQIVGAMDAGSTLVGNLPMQALENPRKRADGYGNHVNDRAVFECLRKHPRAELFSVMPKGDRNRPRK